jgi:uncharacterized protein YjiK
VKNLKDFRIMKHCVEFKKGLLACSAKVLGITLFAAAMLSVSFCNTPSGKKKTFPYDLNNPDEKYLLPDYLKEISGVSFYGEKKILCVQDEKAIIYVLDTDSQEEMKKYDFGKNGDFEDIAVVGQTAYVLRSDGRIFGIENFDKEEIKIREHNTPLSAKNDTEGLTYDEYTKSLFIACKGSPSVDKDIQYKGYKAIYKFDLGEMKLDKKPAYLIDLKRSDSYRDADMQTEDSLKNSKKHRLTGHATSFQPSGLAINPVNSQIYIISSAGKILVILDRQGKVLDLHKLDTEMFQQPEGICFSPSGDLFISNEGRGGKGYILKFKLHNRI